MTSVIESDPSLLSESGSIKGPPRKPVSTATFFGFSVGMVGDRIFRDAPALLLLFYMTDYLAIPPAMAGIAIFVPKLLIMFVDPMVGVISDRLNTPWGQRRPLMFIGALLASVSIVMFFHVPHFGSALPQAIYMSGMIFVGFTGFSFYSVPYLTMASEIASTDQERRMIMAWRVVFMAIGLTISAFAGGFAQWIGGGIKGYEIMSWAFAGICLFTMMSTVAATGRVATSRGVKERVSLIDQFRTVASNKRYMGLVLVSFAQKVGEGVGYTAFPYLFTYVVHQPLSGFGLVVLASNAAQVLTQPLWLKASKRWSGPTIYTVGALGWCVNLLLWLTIKDQSPLWLIPIGLQAGASAGGFLMVTLGMLSNTMAADRAETGLNREGIYSGFWLAVEKLAFALGALLVGVVIGWFGFVQSANGVKVYQTPMAILGIAVAYCGVNMVVYLASIVAMSRVKAPPEPTLAAA